MRDVEFGRAVRALRRRHGWRQEDVARAAGVSQQFVSRLEAGRLESMSFEKIRRCAEALGMHVELDARWRGTELPRLLDAAHARLQDLWKRKLEKLGWLAEAELSFSEYGERGRYDLLCFHPAVRVVLVVEVKSEIADLQDLLGALDAKVRLASRVARRRGWRPNLVVPCVIVADGSTARRRIAEHAALFSRFERRGRPAASWLRKPTGSPTGLLILSKLPSTHGERVKSANRHRVRLTAPHPRSATELGVADAAASRT